MSKYIIKNCPCLEQSDLDKDIYNSCLGATNYIGMCKDCTDCVMKQIVERCREAIKNCDECKGYPETNCIDCTQGGKAMQANEILKLLDIQECE